MWQNMQFLKLKPHSFTTSKTNFNFRINYAKTIYKNSLNFCFVFLRHRVKCLHSHCARQESDEGSLLENSNIIVMLRQ